MEDNTEVNYSVVLIMNMYNSQNCGDSANVLSQKKKENTFFLISLSSEGISATADRISAITSSPKEM